MTKPAWKISSTIFLSLFFLFSQSSVAQPLSFKIKTAESKQVAIAKWIDPKSPLLGHWSFQDFSISFDAQGIVAITQSGLGTKDDRERVSRKSETKSAVITTFPPSKKSNTTQIQKLTGHWWQNQQELCLLLELNSVCLPFKVVTLYGVPTLKIKLQNHWLSLDLNR